MGKNRQAVRLGAALALELCSMWGTGMFWYFRTSQAADDMLPLAGLVALCAALLGLAVASTSSAALGRHAATCSTVTCILAPCCGLVVLAGGGFTANEPVGLCLALACCVVSWMCNAYSLLACAGSLTRLDLPTRLAVTACAAVVAVLPRGLARLVIYAGQGVILFLCAMVLCAAACLLARRESVGLFERCAQADEAPADLQMTQPATFLPFNHRLYLLVGVFGFSAGMSFFFGIDADYPTTSVVSVVPLLLIAVLGIKVRRHLDLDALLIVAFVIAAGAFLSIGFVWNESIIISGALFGAAEACFYVLMFTLLAAIAQRNERNAAVVFGWGLGLFVLGWGVCGFGFNVLAHLFISEVPLLVFPLAWAFIAFNAWFLHGFSVEAAVAGIEAAHEVVAPQARGAQEAGRSGGTGAADAASPTGAAMTDPTNLGRLTSMSAMAVETPTKQPASASDLLEARLSNLAGQAGLTGREREVFELLARGRNAHYLQEQLGISRNTAKTHIAHIYAKLGIHSQQELIDLLDANADE